MADLRLIPETHSLPTTVTTTTVMNPPDYVPVALPFEACPVYTIDQTLQERTPEDYSPEVREIVDLITVQEDILPVGSAKFSVHKYPSDVDIFEKIEGCCTVNEVRFAVANQIQQIVQRILQTDDIFIGDFKAGYDTRYDVYLGEEIDGQIVDYDPAIAHREIDNLYDQGLFTDQEFAEINNLIVDDPNIEEFTKLNDKVRSYYTLRWSTDEILDGYKVLRGNKKLWLDDALIEHSVVKLDLWAPLPYEDLPPECLRSFRQKWPQYQKPWRYVEVTNWILIQQRDNKGNVKTLTQELPDYAKSLRSDIVTYLSEDDLNYLKAAKRFWSYLLFERKVLENKDETLDVKPSAKNELRQQMRNKLHLQTSRKDLDSILKRLAPLFGSYIAFLNAVRGDLELIEKLSQKGLPISDEFFRQSLDGIVFRLMCSAPTCDFDDEVNQTVIDAVTNAKYDYTQLDPILDYLKSTINEMTRQYLEGVNIDIDEILFSKA